MQFFRRWCFPDAEVSKLANDAEGATKHSAVHELNRRFCFAADQIRSLILSPVAGQADLDVQKESHRFTRLAMLSGL